MVQQQPGYVVNPPAVGPTVYVHQQQPTVVVEEKVVIKEQRPRVGFPMSFPHTIQLVKI